MRTWDVTLASRGSANGRRRIRSARTRRGYTLCARRHAGARNAGFGRARARLLVPDGGRAPATTSSNHESGRTGRREAGEGARSSRIGRGGEHSGDGRPGAPRVVVLPESDDGAPRARGTREAGATVRGSAITTALAPERSRRRTDRSATGTARQTRTRAGRADRSVRGSSFPRHLSPGLPMSATGVSRQLDRFYLRLARRPAAIDQYRYACFSSTSSRASPLYRCERKTALQCRD